MYGVDTHSYAHRHVHAGEPRLQIPVPAVWGEPLQRFGWEPEVRGNPGRGRGGEIPLITLSRKSSPPEVPSHILNSLRQFKGSKAS